MIKHSRNPELKLERYLRGKGIAGCLASLVHALAKLETKVKPSADAKKQTKIR